MSTGKRSKKTSGKKTYAHASYLRVSNGQSERGYKAGEMHGVNGHRTHAHQPCVADYTDGALQCPYCAAGLEVQWRGYVPVWDRDWALRYVLIGEDHAESVDVIPRGEQIIVTRAKNPISPLVVRQEQCLTRVLPDRSPWNVPVAMEDICLLLWRIDSLTAWVYDQRAKGEPAKTAPAKSRAYTAPTDNASSLDEDYEAVARRLRATAAKKPASTNGKH